MRTPVLYGMAAAYGLATALLLNHDLIAVWVVVSLLFALSWRGVEAVTRSRGRS